MADQGKWFKLWNSSIEDADLENLELEDWARWAKLGAYIKAHGKEGMIRFPYPYRKLLTMFRVPTIAAAKEILNRFPNIRIGERENTVSTETNANVSLEIEFTNWLKYQGDFSSDRVRKFRDKKRQSETVQEEKRSRKEEIRKEEKRKVYIPTAQEVADYAKSIGFQLDSAHFVNHYEARGWQFKNGQPVRDWKACVRTWKQNGAQYALGTHKTSGNVRHVSGDPERANAYRE